MTKWLVYLEKNSKAVNGIPVWKVGRLKIEQYWNLKEIKDAIRASIKSGESPDGKEWFLQESRKGTQSNLSERVSIGTIWQ